MDRNGNTEHSFYENRLSQSATYMDVSFYENKNFFYPAHWHSEMEMIRIKKGSMLIGVNRICRVMRKDGICLLVTGDIHYYESQDPESEIQILLFRSEIIRTALSSENGLQGFPRRFLTAEMVRKYGLYEIYGLIDRLGEEIKGKRKWVEEMCRAYTMQLLIQIARRWPTNSEEEVREIESSHRKLPQAVLAYMEEHIEEELSIKNLGYYFHIDSSYLGKQMVRATGMHFKEYINAVRIRLAEERLVATDESIVQIAYSCGFKSVRNFNRVFRRISGKTPREVRNEKKQRGEK